MPILFVLATLWFSSYCIRQSFAHVFVYLALYFLNKRKYIWVLFLVPIVFSIHSAAILTLVVCLIIYLLFKYPFNYKIVIIIYCVFVIISMKIIEIISMHAPEYFALISFGGDTVTHYTEQSERWFGEGAVREDNIQSNFAYILTALYVISIIYMGGISLKYSYDKNVTYMYNVTILGFVLHRIFILFELLSRISGPLSYMYFIPVGYSFAFYKRQHKTLTSMECFLFRISIFVFSIYMVLYHGRFLLMPELSGFVWNLE